jgi:ADP-ribose pyrophosphatase YjhB (NUDIX family)
MGNGPDERRGAGPADTTPRADAPLRSTLAHVVGSIPPIPGTSVDFDEEIEEAMADELAEECARVRPVDPS